MYVIIILGFIPSIRRFVYQEEEDALPRLAMAELQAPTFPIDAQNVIVWALPHCHLDRYTLTIIFYIFLFPVGLYYCLLFSLLPNCSVFPC
jgi:hypothetical protein